MREVHVYNLSRPLVTDLTVGNCDSFLCRSFGLTFRWSLPAGWGLLFVYDRENRFVTTITMLGVFMDLAVIWLDEGKRVVDLRLARAWRPIYVPRRAARYFLELAPQRLTEFQIGDVLQFEDAVRD